MSVWGITLICVGLSMILFFLSHCVRYEIRIRRQERQREQITITELSLPQRPPSHRPAPMSTRLPPGCAVVEAPDQSLSLARAV
jgi:hypothetical protein